MSLPLYLQLMLHLVLHLVLVLLQLVMMRMLIWMLLLRMLHQRCLRLGLRLVLPNITEPVLRLRLLQELAARTHIQVPSALLRTRRERIHPLDRGSM